jgi:hypothetical protein
LVWLNTRAPPESSSRPRLPGERHQQSLPLGLLLLAVGGQLRLLILPITWFTGSVAVCGVGWRFLGKVLASLRVSSQRGTLSKSTRQAVEDDALGGR